MPPRTPAKPAAAALPALAEASAVQRAVLSLAEIGHNPRLIPADPEAQAQLIETAVTMGRRLVLVMAMVVSRYRETFNEPSDWLAECERRWGWTRAYIHHLRAVGDLLCRVSHGDTHGVLFSLSWEHVYSISRLPANLVVPFLEKARPEAMTRDECRLAVNRWLAAAGEPAETLPERTGGKRGAPHQLDFIDALFTAARSDGARFAADLRDRIAGTDPALAFPALNRSIIMVEQLLDRTATTRPDALQAIAETLRETADRAATLARAATKGILTA